MKEKLIKKVQEKIIQITRNTIGRSVPLTMYERKIPENLLDEIQTKIK